MGEIIKVYRGDEYVVIDAEAFPGSKWERIGYRMPGQEPEAPESPAAPIEAKPPRAPRRRRRRTKKAEDE